ncbi:phytoene desaturase family protein [Aureispira anguillae]|uniref:NAD(P)/FAD-dependent oxidoreductase n=1 Tax=Aureispira anguillae TaxID=2864201 RepID=A0A915YBX7_9BACT|nr:NAD(P)/FAD-dependent oxidoreductase [Aureispira anguillae]BDS10263.1 NAD(P)/FAD-dependent oxidoreductase [Aureispira anguillae]
MVQSYKKKHQLAASYDTIIIGSGIGSLTAAVMLAKKGQKVLVLERHYTAGGFTHIFKRKGYEWDVGIHYVGSMEKETSILKKIFDYLTDGALKWADMGAVYDRIVIGDQTYDYVKGVGNWTEQMIAYFPEEEQAIRAYVALIFKVSATSKNFFVEKTLSPLWSKLVGGFLRKPYLKYSRQTTHEVLSSLTQNKRLIKVLTGQYGDYGLAPKQSSFAMHASLVRHYFSGGFFPIGGSSQIVATIAPVLARLGSTILISAEVEEVLVEKNTAVGVRMKDGKVFRAKHIISNAGLFTTYKSLLPKASVQQHQLDLQLKKVKHSVAHACLYIGLDGNPDELALPKANYWIYPEQLSHDECIDRYLKDQTQPFPVVYISFPAAKDPDWSNRYPGKSTIDIITLIPYETFAQWDGKRWKKRGEAYEALKETFAQRLLEILYQKEPQLKGKVAYYELSSALSTKHFVNYEKGELYGLEHSPERFEQKFLRPKTPIKNFYLTGQDITTAGIGGAAFAGLLTASTITGKNIAKELME